MSSKGAKGLLMGKSSIVNANKDKDKKQRLSRCSRVILQFLVGFIHRLMKSRIVVNGRVGAADAGRVGKTKDAQLQTNNVYVIANLMAIVQSQRLSLFHLGSDLQQARLFGTGTSNMLKVEGNMAQASATISQKNLQDQSKKDNRRLLHVVCHVGDLDKTIKFYTEC
eukprot:Gb_37662 [translate_table: standard]